MSFTEHLIKEAVKYNLENELPLTECIFRRESEKFYDYFNYLKEHKDNLELSGLDKELLETDIGEFGLYEGEEVPLDLPFVEELDEKKKLKKSDMEDDPCWDGYTMVGTKNKNGKKVPNCVKISEADEKQPELNSPKRNSGPGKKYYVYVKNDKGNVQKVTFGDEKGGLSSKINDPEARKSFVARHECSTKKDKTSPGYWSCRLPYYAKQLGLSGGGNFFW